MSRLFEKESFENRMKGIEQASGRARAVFLATTILTLTILGACFNCYFSLLRAAAEKEFRYGEGSGFTDTIQEQLAKAWTESTFVSIPGFGVKFSVGDVILWGSTGLTVAALWLFFCMRRENHLIGYTLYDASTRSAAEADETIYEFVAFGVRASQVFATGSHDDRRFRSIQDVADKIRAEMDADEGKGPRLSWYRRALGGARKFVAIWTRVAIYFMLCFPVFGCLAILAVEYASLEYIPALFRGGDQRPHGWEFLFKPDILWRVCVCGFFTVVSGYFGYKTALYHDGTRKLLEGVAEEIKALEVARLKKAAQKDVSEKSPESEAEGPLANG